MVNLSYITYITTVLFGFVLLSSSPVYAFSFSDHNNDDSGKQEETEIPTRQNLTCLNNKKIASMVGERHGTEFSTNEDYGSIVAELNNSFSNLGLKTYTPAEITAQIAKAEQEAFLGNDMDAAANAADRLSADFVLRGLISTKIQKNPVVAIDEIFISFSLTLHDRHGKKLSSVTLSDAVFSTADTIGTVRTLVSDKASQIAFELYNDFCKKVKPE